MPYILRVDLLTQLTESQLVQLTDDEKQGVANDGFIDRAIVDAEAEIDGYLATKYAIPVKTAQNTTPQVVKKLATDIAVKNLFGRRQRIPESVQATYDKDVEFLKGIASGVTTLGTDPSPIEGGKGSSGEAIGPERLFSRDTLSGF